MINTHNKLKRTCPIFYWFEAYFTEGLKLKGVGSSLCNMLANDYIQATKLVHNHVWANNHPSLRND